MTEEEQRQYIRDHYLTTPGKRIAQIIGRSGCFVYGQMKREGLIVPPEELERRKQLGRIKPGNVPMNKGKKQTEYMTAEQIERTKATRFKKGNKPHNTQPEYHISKRYHKTNKTNYLYIKLSDAHHELLHRHLWRLVYGDIPEGHNIQFKDGNELNVAIDNLYSTERGYQVRVNKKGGKKLPFDLRKTINLITKLKKQINEKQDHRP